MEQLEHQISVAVTGSILAVEAQNASECWYGGIQVSITELRQHLLCIHPNEPFGVTLLASYIELEICLRGHSRGDFRYLTRHIAGELGHDMGSDGT